MAIGIYGQFDCRTTDGVIAVAEQIKDTEFGKFQSEINAELYEAVDGIAGSSAITELGDRVTAVENDLETKADADAVYSKTDADGKFASKSSVDTLTAKANLVEEIATQNTVSLITINSNHSALAERVSEVETALTGVEQLLATI